MYWKSEMSYTGIRLEAIRVRLGGPEDDKANTNNRSKALGGEKPLRGVAVQGLLVVGAADPADITIGSDEAEGISGDGVGVGKYVKRKMVACGPVGEAGRRGAIAMQLPVECCQRSVVVLLLKPGKAVAAVKAAYGAGAEAAFAILDAGL